MQNRLLGASFGTWREAAAEATAAQMKAEQMAHAAALCVAMVLAPVVYLRPRPAMTCGCLIMGLTNPFARSALRRHR